MVKYDRGVGKVKLTDVPVPEVSDDQVLIRAEIAGVCGTDVHIHQDRYETAIPVTLGHEFSGRIVQVGKRVDGWTIGHRVVAANYACGRCRVCLKGSPNTCPQKRAIGFRSDGCFAEFIAVPASVLHRIPDNVDDRTAALTEPLAVAVHATMTRGALNEGDTGCHIRPWGDRVDVRPGRFERRGWEGCRDRHQ